MLFGFKGDAFQHELGDEMSDNAVIRLRQIMSDRFGFDFKELHTRDAVISLALEHCFDPVRDMLDRAEAAWDGEKRLDRMAARATWRPVQGSHLEPGPSDGTRE